MAENETKVMTSHNLLNYSGMLFNKGNTRTPFSTTIGGKFRTVNHWSFPVSLSYTTGGGTTQPAITRSASLVAPTLCNQDQATNVCRITKLLHFLWQTVLNGTAFRPNIAGGKPTQTGFPVANAMAK